ncbi:STAS domain-containing protein [Candidatus Uabimicrobium sp. HlEnr_7]|uniref:STAS domain-containing protein n=1 Tax=Candidatus Uabimicrobium helgolandensis TaxID=3095367 RepID=UPI003557CA55
MKKIDFITQTFPLSQKNNIVFIAMLGAINKYTTIQIQKFYQSLKKEDTIIILSLTDVHYIDSTGIGFLANLQQQCEDANVDLKMCMVSAKIYHLFEMLGMTSCFAIFDTIKDTFIDLQKSGKLKNSIEHYLQKIERLDKTSEEVPKAKNSQLKPESLTTILEITYPDILHIKKESVIEIKIANNCGNKYQVVPHVKSCIVQPPFFYLDDNCSKVYFSIIPVTSAANTFLNIDIFNDQHQRISRPICIKKRIWDKKTILKYTIKLKSSENNSD